MLGEPSDRLAWSLFLKKKHSNLLRDPSRHLFVPGPRGLERLGAKWRPPKEARLGTRNEAVGQECGNSSFSLRFRRTRSDFVAKDSQSAPGGFPR